MFTHLACVQTAKNSASTKQTQELKAEIELLQQKVKAKETEIASVKKQAGQNATAYEELSGPVSLFSIGFVEEECEELIEFKCFLLAERCEARQGIDAITIASNQHRPNDPESRGDPYGHSPFNHA